MIPHSMLKVYQSRIEMIRKELQEENMGDELREDIHTDFNSEGLINRFGRKVSSFCKKPELDESNYYNENEMEFYSIIWINITIYTFFILSIFIGVVILGISLRYSNFLSPKTNPFWLAFFISTSAFLNCGTILIDGNIETLADPTICFTISILILFGNVLLQLSLKFILWCLYQLSTKRRKLFKYILENCKETSPLMARQEYYSWTYGVSNISLIVIGFLFTFFNDSIQMRNTGVESFLTSLFLPISARNAGISFMDLSLLSNGTLVFYMFLMYIKPKMVYNLGCRVCEMLSKTQQVTVQHQEKSFELSPNERLYSRVYSRVINISSELVSKISISTQLLILIFFTLVISISEISHISKYSIFGITFEVTSALSNTGFSLGIPNSTLSLCSEFNIFSKLLLCIVMLIGRAKYFKGLNEKS